jgi:hypothetical protein
VWTLHVYRPGQQQRLTEVEVEAPTPGGPTLCTRPSEIVSEARSGAPLGPNTQPESFPLNEIDLAYRLEQNGSRLNQ